MIKIGMFGTGIMADIYGALLRQRKDVALVGIVGNTPEKTKEVAEKLGTKGYPNARYDDFLAEHPDVDALILATPEWARREPLAAAVRSKKALLLEKPFADSWESAREFHAMLRDYPALVRSCHVLRYSSRFFAMYEAVRRGDIGEPRHIFARRNSNNVRVQRVMGKADLSYWLAPHDVDIMRWVTGREVDRVYAVSRNKLRSADDYLIANLRFEGGVDAVLEVSWCAPPLSGHAREAVFEIRGTKGTVELEDFNMNVKVFTEGAKVATPDTYEDYVVQGLRDGFFAPLIDGFLRDLKDPQPGGATLTDAFETTRACAMIRRSLDEERPVYRAEME